MKFKLTEQEVKYLWVFISGIGIGSIPSNPIAGIVLFLLGITLIPTNILIEKENGTKN